MNSIKVLLIIIICLETIINVMALYMIGELIYDNYKFNKLKKERIEEAKRIAKDYAEAKGIEVIK